MIGWNCRDNPDTDVFGANLYDAYLQRKSKSRSSSSKIFSPEAGAQLDIHTALSAGATSEIAKLVHQKPVTQDVQDDVEDLLTAEKDEDFAETCISILVESGVYRYCKWTLNANLEGLIIDPPLCF